MYDKELVCSSLNQIRTTVDTIVERSKGIHSVDDFLGTQGGVLLLDAICMNLIALGEAVKNLDKVSNNELLPQYGQLNWSGIMRMRDKIAHHYFDVDAEVVLKTVKEDIPQIETVINQMISELTR